MEPPVLVFVVGLVIALAVVALVATARGRTLARLGRLAGASPGADPTDAVLDLQARTRRVETELDLAVRDRAALIDVIEVGIVHLDDRLRIDLANAAAHRLLDRPAGYLMGRAAIEAVIDTAFESIAATARETGTASGELAIRREAGPIVTVHAARTPSGGTWLIMQDVSELRRLQRIRAEFIDNLSHELRTPLTAVSLLAETLVREAAEAGEAIPVRMRDRISKIEVETDHLAQIVSELLDLSRIESGGPIRMADMVDLGLLAVSTTERLRLFAERQGVELVARSGHPVPPVLGAEERLGQALVNLLHNAVKFSPDGGVVTVTVGTQGSDVTVAVEDHGIGIARADQDRIFERFYKADKARRRGGGTGLGLAIVRHVIEAHGGWIRVESVEGEGSAFIFGIPAVTDADMGAPPRSDDVGGPIREASRAGVVAGVDVS